MEAYLKKLHTKVLSKKWNNMWINPTHKEFKPIFKGIETKFLDQKVKKNLKFYANKEIVEIRILVNPKAATYKPVKKYFQTLKHVPLSILTRIYTISETGELKRDKKDRCLVINYQMEDLKEGKFKLTFAEIKMIMKYMVRNEVVSNPLDGMDLQLFFKKALAVKKKQRKKKK